MNYYLGIDIGGTNIKDGLLDETGKILNKGKVKTSIKGKGIISNIIIGAVYKAITGLEKI